MTFRPILIAAALLMLSACDTDKSASTGGEAAGEPQIATSIEDYALPVDRSSQITSIDAATGDASGMPRDGGAVVSTPKPEPRPPAEAPETPAATVTLPPLNDIPPPPAPPPSAPAVD